MQDCSQALSTGSACRPYPVESMSKMELVLFITFLENIWVAFVQLAHSSLGEWKDIFVIHLIVIIKSEVSTFPIVVIFSVPKVVVPSYFVVCYTYIHISREYWDLFPLLMSSLMCLQIIVYIMACRRCSFVCILHSLPDLSESNELLKCLSGICYRVSV